MTDEAKACPVAPLAYEAARTIRMREMIEFTDGEQFERLTIHLECLEQSVSRLRATSQEGLFYQALVGFGALDLVADWMRNDACDEARDAAKQAAGCMTSLAMALYSPELEPLTSYYMTRTFEAEAEAVAA